MLNFIGDEPRTDCTKNIDYLRSLSEEALRFLDAAKGQKDDLLKDALALWESNSQYQKWELCEEILSQLEDSLGQKKTICRSQFFCICILDMVSKTSETAKRILSSTDNNNNVPDFTHPSSEDYSVKRDKTFEILFHIIQSKCTFNPFEEIKKATGATGATSMKFGRNSDLLFHVESCLFELKPLRVRSRKTIQELQLDTPSGYVGQKLIFLTSTTQV